MMMYLLEVNLKKKFPTFSCYFSNVLFKCIIDLLFPFISGYLVSGMHNGRDVGRETLISRNRSYPSIKMTTIQDKLIFYFIFTK